MKYVTKNTGREAFAGGIGIAVAAIVGWALNEFAGVAMPGEIVGALGAVIAWGAHKIEEISQ